MESCENCHRMIGHLETPHVYRDHVVCAECKERLASVDAEQRVSPPPVPRPSSPVEQPADADVWKSLRWLGLGMFAIGGILELGGAPGCGYFGLLGLVIWLIAGVVSLSTKE